VLVDEVRQGRSVRAWAWSFWLALLALVITTVSIAPHFRNSMELVRMRNALLLQSEPSTRFDWTPATVPADFLVERGPPDPRFVSIVEGLRLQTLGSDWERARAIGHHLLRKSVSGSGMPIQDDLNTTYRRIVDQGHGYCGDYVDVFTGLALAAGIPARAWAFSFDGFGGHGHIFNEIWDREAGAWRMIDVFNNVYFARGDNVPLSALAFREALARGDPDLRMLRVSDAAPPRYKYPEKAWDYYRRGLGHWYQWWGNNVFSYDRSLAVRTLGHFNRSFEQLGGIATGVHPGIRVVPEPINAGQLQALQRLRATLLVIVALIVITFAAFVGWRVARWRAPKR
jgi:hypothetical protein